VEIALLNWISVADAEMKGQSTSYESAMLKRSAMPTRKQVQEVLLRALLKHGGVIKEFGSGEEMVGEMADELGLGKHQRSAF